MATPGPEADGADSPTGSDTSETENEGATDDDQPGSGTEGASGVDDLTGFMLTDEITDRTVAHRLQSEFNAEAKAVILKMKRQAARDEIYSKKLQQEEEKQHRGRGSKRVSERHQKAQKRQEKETEGQGEGSRIKKKRKVAEPEREQAEEEAKHKQKRKRVPKEQRKKEEEQAEEQENAAGAQNSFSRPPCSRTR